MGMMLSKVFRGKAIGHKLVVTKVRTRQLLTGLKVLVKKRIVFRFQKLAAFGLVSVPRKQHVHELSVHTR